MSKARFEWDPTKDLENQQKHGVAFVKAQYAFADPQRVIAADPNHSERKSVITVLGGLVMAFLRSDLPIVRK